MARKTQRERFLEEMLDDATQREIIASLEGQLSSLMGVIQNYETYLRTIAEKLGVPWEVKTLTSAGRPTH